MNPKPIKDTNNDKKTVVSKSKIKHDEKQPTMVTVIEDNNSDTSTSYDNSSTSSMNESDESVRVVCIKTPPRSGQSKNPKVKDTYGYSRNFTNAEQCDMLSYLIKKRRIGEARGFTVWKDMIKDGYLKHRTVYSLNNHFRKVILPNIDNFMMTTKAKNKFKSLIKTSGSKK